MSTGNSPSERPISPRSDDGYAAQRSAQSAQRARWPTAIANGISISTSGDTDNRGQCPSAAIMTRDQAATTASHASYAAYAETGAVMIIARAPENRLALTLFIGV